MQKNEFFSGIRSYRIRNPISDGTFFAEGVEMHGMIPPNTSITDYTIFNYTIFTEHYQATGTLMHWSHSNSPVPVKFEINPDLMLIVGEKR